MNSHQAVGCHFCIFTQTFLGDAIETFKPDDIRVIKAHIFAAHGVRLESHQDVFTLDTETKTS